MSRSRSSDPAAWARCLAAPILVAALACAPAGDPTFESEAEPGAPPVRDVILVTVDTLRADALGFAGNGQVATPVFDRLAAEGRVFPEARSHNVVTLPSHANILTGLLPYEHGVRDNIGFKLDASVPTLATRLREAGFATGAFVAAYPLDARFGLDRGFDVYDDRLPAADAGTRVAERPGGEVVAAARAWWTAEAGRRRFLWVHFYEPHAPYLPPEPFASRHPSAPYLGEVETVDAHLGSLLAPVVEGPPGDVLVVVTSDHGEALGSHGEQTHGLFAYEPTLRVPLVLWGGAVEPGVDPRPARHVDIAPTVLSRVGLEPGRSSGDSLLAPAAGGSVTYFEALTATLANGWAPLRGVVEGRLKAIELPEPELYDLAADGAEGRNRAESDKASLRRLLRLLPRESQWPPRAGEATREELVGLEALGYLGGGGEPKSTFTLADDPKRLVGVQRLVHEAVGALEARDPERAARLAREALGERPDMAAAHYYLAQALLAAGREDEALAGMRAAWRDGHASASLGRQLALTLASAGEPQEALSVLRPAVEAGDLEALNVLGVVLSEAGDQEGARRQLLRAESLDADNPTTQETLALVAVRTGAWAEARIRAERALAADPALPLAWSYLGGALYNLGEPGEAIAAWERSLAIDPGNYDVLYNLAVVAQERGERIKARAALERFIAGAPRDRYAPDVEQARRRLRALAQGGS